MENDYCFEIKKIRKELKMTQSEFSNYLGVKLSVIKAWECRSRKPTETTFNLIRRVVSAEQELERYKLDHK